MTTFIDILKRTDIFYDLTPTQLDRVSALCQERTGQAGEFIFEENSAGDELYIIVRGEVEILVDPSMVSTPGARRTLSPVMIATLRDGQIFGEVALVDQGLRSASARCMADNMRLLIIPRAKLLALCETDPELGYRIMRNVAADLAFKIRNSDLAIREQLLWRPRQAV
ncbi:MAG: cyclic nucleotide-binding domain-containing protein [Thermoflexales bacterium]|nr:cyclic nucleotide-binding domain-containing protein [Thermoflexales bacterium]